MAACGVLRVRSEGTPRTAPGAWNARRNRTGEPRDAGRRARKEWHTASKSALLWPGASFGTELFGSDVELSVGYMAVSAVHTGKWVGFRVRHGTPGSSVSSATRPSRGRTTASTSVWTVVSRRFACKSEGSSARGADPASSRGTPTRSRTRTGATRKHVTARPRYPRSLSIVTAGLSTKRTVIRRGVTARAPGTPSRSGQRQITSARAVRPG